MCVYVCTHLDYRSQVPNNWVLAALLQGMVIRVLEKYKILRYWAPWGKELLAVTVVPNLYSTPC